MVYSPIPSVILFISLFFLTKFAFAVSRCRLLMSALSARDRCENAINNVARVLRRNPLGASINHCIRLASQTESRFCHRSLLNFAISNFPRFVNGSRIDNKYVRTSWGRCCSLSATFTIIYDHLSVARDQAGNDTQPVPHREGLRHLEKLIVLESMHRANSNSKLAIKR